MTDKKQIEAGAAQVPEKMSTRKKGQCGEEHAVLFLRERNYNILAVNWRCRSGEIDVIAEQEGTLVFVEVRSRTGNRFGTPQESVNLRKQRQVRETARYFLHQQKRDDAGCRFDVIAVMLSECGELRSLEHILGAF